MSSLNLSELLSLDVPERARLAQALWDSIAELPDAVPLTDDEREELDRRLAAHLADPGEGSPWEVVKARILRQ